MTAWGLWRPDEVARQVKAFPENLRERIVEGIQRILADPHHPTVGPVSRLRGVAHRDRSRYVVEVTPGWFITYEIFDGVAPLIAVKAVRIVAIYPLPEYRRLI